MEELAGRSLHTTSCYTGRGPAVHQRCMHARSTCRTLCFGNHCDGFDNGGDVAKLDDVAWDGGPRDIAMRFMSEATPSRYNHMSALGCEREMAGAHRLLDPRPRNAVAEMAAEERRSRDDATWKVAS